MDSTEYDYLFKLVVVGDSGVGKSSICTRYTKGVFDPRFLTTIGVDFECQTIELDGKVVKLQIWDTAGQERFKAITNSFYRGAHGIVIVFDLTNWESFANVKHWLEEVNRREGEVVNKLLIGNKCDQDLKRVISFDAANEYANKLKIPYLETSAMRAINVDQAFVNMASEIKTRLISSCDSDDNSGQDGVLPVKSYHKSYTGCCQLM